MHPRTAGHCRLLGSRGRVWAPPGDPTLDSRARKQDAARPQEAGSPHCAGLARAGRGPEAASVPGRGAVRVLRAPRTAPLLGIVNPAVLGSPLLPARGQLVLAVGVIQARVAQGCHGCGGSGRSPAGRRVSAPRNSLRLQPRAARPARSRLRTAPPGASRPPEPPNPGPALSQLPEQRRAGPQENTRGRAEQRARPLGWK